MVDKADGTSFLFLKACLQRSEHHPDNLRKVGED